MLWVAVAVTIVFIIAGFFFLTQSSDGDNKVSQTEQPKPSRKSSTSKRKKSKRASSIQQPKEASDKDSDTGSQSVGGVAAAAAAQVVEDSVEAVADVLPDVAPTRKSSAKAAPVTNVKGAAPAPTQVKSEDKPKKSPAKSPKKAPTKPDQAPSKPQTQTQAQVGATAETKSVQVAASSTEKKQVPKQDAPKSPKTPIVDPKTVPVNKKEESGESTPKSPSVKELAGSLKINPAMFGPPKTLAEIKKQVSADASKPSQEVPTPCSDSPDNGSRGTDPESPVVSHTTLSRPKKATTARARRKKVLE